MTQQAATPQQKNAPVWGFLAAFASAAGGALGFLYLGMVGGRFDPNLLGVICAGIGVAAVVAYLGAGIGLSRKRIAPSLFMGALATVGIAGPMVSYMLNQLL